MQFRTGIYLSLVLAGLAAIAIVAGSRASQSPIPNDSPKQPVIVELFTSEGCSSCPPADALLKQLSDQQPVQNAEIVALEEHVDYWNQLGWTDPFSSQEFSLRQEEYARVLRKGGVYTPQMVVDGNTELVGSRRQEAQTAIQGAAAAAKATVMLQQISSNKSKATFNVRIEKLSAAATTGKVELWLAVTETGLHNDVKAGENSGETLQHADVVRTIRKLETLRNQDDASTQITVDLKPVWNVTNVRVVAFLVDKSSRRILGAATSHLVV
jgi:hypothetical protein